MKKILLLSLSLSSAIIASAQLQLLSKTLYSTNQNDVVNCVDLGFPRNLLTAQSYFDPAHSWSARFIRIPLYGLAQTSITVGNTDVDEGVVMKYNNNGYNYTAGHFTGSVNFSNTTFWSTPLHSPNGKGVFLVKYDTFGIPYAQFAVGITPNATTSVVNIKDMETDMQGNMYITGNFKGDVTFGGVGTRTAGTYGSIYFAKYNSAGVAQWLKQIDLVAFPGMNRYIAANALALDESGAIYIAGHLDNTVDLDPDAGVVNSVGSYGSSFVAKYDNNGAYIRSLRIADGVNLGEAYNIAIQNDMVYITGKYGWSNADFDPSPATVNLPDGVFNGNMYLAKYDTSLSYQWAKAVSGTGVEYGNAMAMDDNGNIIIAIQHNGAIEMRPEGPSMPIGHSGNYDATIARYDSNGNLLSADKFGGNGGDYINSLAVTSSGDSLIIAGSFTGTVNFDLAGGNDNVTTAGGSDGYIAFYSMPTSVLPVSMSPLTAHLTSEGIAILNWTTFSEHDNQGFYIEKSNDAKNYETLQFISSDAENGNSSAKINYQFQDLKYNSGKPFYRIKQMDINNTASYSNVVKVNSGRTGEHITCFPNPTKGLISIHHLPANSNIQLFNATGNLQLEHRSPTASHTFDIAHLPAGIYLLTVTLDMQTVYQTQIVLTK